jgi:hypothetical protein
MDDQVPSLQRLVRPFSLDKSSAFLANALLKKMSKRPEIRRHGTTFVPRVRGSSESISRVGGAAGILQERPKTMKENEIMKSQKIMLTVLSALVCFGLMPVAKAVEPAAPDTGFPGGNTADGDGARPNGRFL